MSLKLSDFVVDEQICEFDYDGIPGLKFQLAYLSRDALRKLVKEYTKKTRKPGTRELQDELDEEAYVDAWVSRVLRGWSGLKCRHLVKLQVPMSFPEEQLDEEVPYNEENAKFLIENSVEFRDWMNDQLNDVENFTKKN